VHHSDRGVQYASEQYTGLLKENKILISMSRTGNPYDNAKAESFIKTLKMEEVYLYEYENIDEVYSRIGEFIEEVYNQKRLHSSLGYVPPAEFEQSLFRLKIA
jgi:putative transposase